MRSWVLTVAVLSIGCVPAPAGSVASPLVIGAAAPAPSSAGAAGAQSQRLADGGGGVAGAETSGASGVERGIAGIVGDKTTEPTQPRATGGDEHAALTPHCLPYAQDVTLRGVVERPPLSAKAPAKKGESRADTNTAWRFRLDSPRCVGAASDASKPVETMILVPMQDIAKTYRKLEGQRVEATGVLIGLVSASDVHVVYMVRAFTPVPSP